MKRVDAVDAVEILRRQRCSYRSPRCDCKFGVVQLGLVNGGHEHGCGCPELGEVALVLAGLTERQYVEAYRLGGKRAVRMRSRTSRVVRDARRPEEVSIYAVGLSIRAANALRNTTRITTVADIAKLSFDDLRAIRNCGLKTVREIRAVLAKFGLTFRGETRLHDPAVVLTVVERKCLTKLARGRRLHRGERMHTALEIKGLVRFVDDEGRSNSANQDCYKWCTITTEGLERVRRG